MELFHIISLPLLSPIVEWAWHSPWREATGRARKVKPLPGAGPCYCSHIYYVNRMDIELAVGRTFCACELSHTSNTIQGQIYHNSRNFCITYFCVFNFCCDLLFAVSRSRENKRNCKNLKINGHAQLIFHANLIWVFNFRGFLQPQIINNRKNFQAYGNNCSSTDMMWVLFKGKYISRVVSIRGNTISI